MFGAVSGLFKSVPAFFQAHRSHHWRVSFMDHSFLSAFVLLLLVLDPLGSLPVFIPVMRYPPSLGGVS
jgi:hypothetical protein